MHELASNPRLLVLFQVAKMALFPVAVLPLYLAEQCGLTVTEVIWLQAFFGLVIAVTEFPSGYLADRIGYRRTLWIGATLLLLAWGVYPFAHDFWSLLVVELLLGVALACVSGCDSALLYESLRTQGQVERFGALFSRQHSAGQVAEGCAALFSGVLYAWEPRSIFWVQAGVTVMMVAAAWSMREPPRTATIRQGSHLRQAVSTVRDALRAEPRLARLLALWTVFSLASYLPVWLFAPYATELGVPVGWLGPLWAASNFVVAAGSLSASPLRARAGLVRTALAGVLALITGYGGLALSYAAWGATFYFAICWMRGLITSLLSPEEHALLPSGDRASLVSFRSMIFRSSFFVLGPLMGVMVEAQGYAQSFGVAGVALALSATALVPLALGRGPAREASPEAAATAGAGVSATE